MAKKNAPTFSFAPDYDKILKSNYIGRREFLATQYQAISQRYLDVSAKLSPEQKEEFRLQLQGISLEYDVILADQLEDEKRLTI